LSHTGPETSSYTVHGNRIEAARWAPGLHIVATPIGNLGDITVRALETLSSADLIACEDTRVTAKLLRHYGIHVPTVAYHDHNAARRRPELLEALAQGRMIALVSDAGTPLVSDPGYRLVRETIDAGHPVTALPGASALLAGLAIAGLPSDTFLFAGFLPPKTVGRRKRLETFVAVPATLVFYEAPQRLAESLADMAAVLGDREAVVARELTKRFEERAGDRLAGLAVRYAQSGPPKGELVVLVAPPGDEAPGEEEIETTLRRLMETESVSRAAALAADATGLPRKELYRRALAIAGRG